MIYDDRAPQRKDISALLDSEDEVTFDTLKNAFPTLDNESIKAILSDLDSYRK